MKRSGDPRFAHLLASLERIAGGDFDHRIEISEGHDEIDAIGHAVNVLVGEVQLTAEGLHRAKEEAEAASAAKSVFLRNASHEIRTPLTVILGLAELIASRRIPDHRLDEMYQRIVTNGRALTRILDDLLDLAKVEAEKLEFESQPVVVARVVAEVVVGFELEAARKGLQLTCEPHSTSPIAIADPHRLRQILTNLVGNAIKFTARGGVSVHVTTTDDGGHAIIEVSDTGIGLTAEQAGALFEPFAQADRSISSRFGGTGLGLALSKRFAEAMGGTLELLSSQHSVGTTFRLTLPAARATAEVRTATPRRKPITGTELRGRRILVVDDNEDVRTTTSELIRQTGATVIEAADGQRAIERWHEVAVDAILMDVRMPVLDGIEATRRLRAEGARVPIIALTADAVADQETTCLAAGCSGYLVKPLDLERLLAVLAADHVVAS